jgi:hypothetical protein
MQNGRAWQPVIRVPAFASERIRRVASLFDDGRCAQSVADLTDDFIKPALKVGAASRGAKRAAQPTAIPSSPVESAAVEALSVAPVSKLPKPAPATDAATLKAELKRWCGRKSAGAHT